jgi:drug/metabolite transporter (DMT)-like permease
MSPRSWSLLQVHVAVLLFGLAGVLRDLLPTLSSAAVVFGRVVFAAPVLLVAALVLGPLPRVRGRRDLFAFVGLGALLAVHWTTFFQSVQDAGVAIALLTYSTFPVFVSLLEPPLFHEKPRGIDLVLAGIALLGVAILLPGFEAGDRVTQGVFWGVASGLTFALLSLLNRKYVRHYPGLTVALYQDAFAAAVLLPFMLANRPALSVRDIEVLAVLGVLCTAVAHSLFIAGLRRVKTRTASMIACLEPVYGPALAVPLLHQVPSVRTVLGGLVILGVALYATLQADGDVAPAEAPAKEKEDEWTTTSGG